MKSSPFYGDINLIILDILNKYRAIWKLEAHDMADGIIDVLNSDGK